MLRAGFLGLRGWVEMGRRSWGRGLPGGDPSTDKCQTARGLEY